MAKRTEKKKRRFEPVVYAAICVAVILGVTVLDTLNVFEKIEYSTYDLRFQIRGNDRLSDKIAVVAIDAQTLDMLGIKGMPSRDYHVKLIENLYKAGAKAVLLDILFLNPSGEMIEDSLFTALSPNDSLLADVLHKYPQTVIARKIQQQMYINTASGDTPLPIELFRNPQQLAFVDMFQDTDSSIRRARLIFNDQPPENGWNYSLAMKAAMIVMGADSAWVDTKNQSIHAGDRVIPVDGKFQMMINYSIDENTYTENLMYLSYSQILDDNGLKALTDRRKIQGKVILVGATFYESHDDRLTPLYQKLFSKKKTLMYGVHIHQEIASTIIDNRFIPPVQPWQSVALIALMALIATLINYRFKGFGGLFLSIGIVALYAFIAVILFIEKRYLIPVVAPAFATVTLSYMSAVTYNFLSERRQKTMIRGAFAHYVPGTVVSELLKNPDMLKLGGEERVMTVIFSDVAGFTTISERLTPTQLVELLNEYLTAMTDIVFSHGGIIDKYEGDAIMAEFGAPLPDEMHALKACHAALDMQKTLAVMRKKLKAEGRPELHARVGINSGPMVIGNMGSREIFDYTVMGDNVNLSSRLEGVNKVYGTYIMCSEATRLMVGDEIVTRELDIIRVKGKTEGVKIHEVLARAGEGLGDVRSRVVETYLLGLDAYKNRKWAEGIERFRETLAIDPSDGPSALYLQRCEEFLEHPPGDDWDGIFTMRTK
jgi:adenylate cyclase